MGKIVFSIAVIVLIGGLAYQNWQLQQQQKTLSAKVNELDHALAKEKNIEQQLQSRLSQENSELKREQQVRQNELQALYQQLTTERARLANLEEHFKQIKSKGGDANGNQAVQEQIKRDQERLKSLNVRLSDYQSAEKEAHQEGTQSLNTNKAQSQAQNAQIDKRLKEQQALLKETDKQISIWKKRAHDINQNNRLSELNKQREEQATVLAQIQNDKSNLNFSGNQKSRQIKEEMDLEQEDLKDTQGQIKKQIQQTEADLKMLQGESGKFQSLKAAHENELRDAQSELEQQKLKVQNLTQEYERKRADLSPAGK